MSPSKMNQSCPLCHVKVTGTICPVCRTSFVNQAQPSLARMILLSQTGTVNTQSERTVQYGNVTDVSRHEIEGTVIKEMPPAEWRRREPWAVVAGLLLFVVALPLIATVGLFIMTLVILLGFFGVRLFGGGALGSILMFPLLMFRGNPRQPRQARQFIVRTSEGNRRVVQIGEWNSYLYEGCHVRLRGRERQGLLLIESGEDLDNRSTTLVRHDRQWPWSSIAAVLAVVAFLEYASLLAGTGY